MARRKAEPKTEEITEQVIPTETIIEPQPQKDTPLEQEGEIHTIEVIRHTQIFDSEINSETVQALINELNSYMLVDLQFSSPGGSISAMSALVRYLNNRSGEIDVYLVDGIASAATFLLTDYVGAVYLTDDLEYLLFHKADRMMYTVRKDDLSKKQLAKQLKETNGILRAKYEILGLNNKELKAFDKGYDAILYRKDFSRLYTYKDLNFEE